MLGVLVPVQGLVVQGGDPGGRPDRHDVPGKPVHVAALVKLALQPENHFNDRILRPRGEDADGRWSSWCLVRVDRHLADSLAGKLLVADPHPG